MLLDRIAKNNREIAKIEKEIKRAEKELAFRLARVASRAASKKTSMCNGKKKNDGTPDMRFKANRGCR